MGTAIKHSVPDWASECPDIKNYKWRLNPVWHSWHQLYPYGNGRQRNQLKWISL